MGYELFALVSAIGWSANGVLVKKGARYSGVSSAVFLSFAATAAFMWAIGWWYFPSGFYRSPGLLYFVLSGLIQPAVVRVLHYIGIVRLGVSRAEPVRSITPLFAAMIAIAFLGERPGLVVYVAIFFTIAGITLISYRREGEASWRALDLAFPLTAALLAAISQNIRKAGLLILPNPFVAATITTTTSLIVFLATLAVSRNTDALRVDRSSLPFYGAAALLSAVSQLLTFTALAYAEVSVVVTLTNTSPLFTVALSSVFLKDVERVTARVVLGAVVLVTAIAILLNR